MKKIVHSLILISLIFSACNSPKQRANKALRLAEKGVYIQPVTDYDFEYKNLFTYEPFVKNYLNEPGSKAIVKAFDAAKYMIQIPNLLDNFQLIKTQEDIPMDIISVASLTDYDGKPLDQGMIDFYMGMDGVINKNKGYIKYTYAKNAERTTLFYAITKNGVKDVYRIEMIKINDEWKIYTCRPESDFKL